jgi:hypothetical protein
VLAVEHLLAVLVVDRCPGRDLTGVAVRGQIDDLQLRVESVSPAWISARKLHETLVKAMNTSPMYCGNRDLEILERPRFDDREGGWIELVQAGVGWRAHSGYSLRRACTDRVGEPVAWRMRRRIAAS